MKLTCYMAISIDGLITLGENDSDWVSKNDWQEFHKYVEQSDAIIMGRKTMEQFGEDFPVSNKVNIVLSKNKKLHKNTEKLIIIAGTPNEILEIAKSKNCENILLIGGANTNQQFIKSGLVDEIVLSIHPLVIGKGLRLFGNEDLDIKLQLLDSKIIDNELVQIRYKVLKTH